MKNLRAFIIVAAILLICAVGMNGATQFMQLHFRKLPAPPARPLSEVPAQLGPWVQVSIDEPLNPEFQDALATDKYIFRDYVDSRLLTQAEMDAFKDKSSDERRRLLQTIQMKKPQAVVNVGLTYYTGLVDTVAHIPDRCYIADGYEPTKYDIMSWSALDGRPGDGKVRFIVFEDTTPGRVSIRRNVAYFFNCNGQYMNDSIAVRKRLAYLLEKYGYYMKVEMQMLQVEPEKATTTMNDFLTYLLPESEKCLPDWKKLESAR